MAQSSLASTYGLIRGPIVDVRTGMPTYSFSKWFLDISPRIEGTINSAGTISGTIAYDTTVQGHPGTLGNTLQFLDENGKMLGPGIDFTRPYLNKTTDNITDGTGSPLAGGKAAYEALVTNPPLAQAHKWINAFDDTSGDFTLTQPDFSDLSGTASPAQLPIATTSAFGVVKPDGTTITIAAGVITAIAGVALNFADNETPSGAIDGVNVTYTLAHPPSPTASLILVLGGLVQNQGVGNDFTVSGSTISFASAPNFGPLLAWYRY